MQTMFISERWETIAELLGSRGRVTVEELADMLRVSSATIRRDLRQMERQGMINRTRGGATRSTKVAYDRSPIESQGLLVPEKERIGKLAASLIERGDTVVMDGGSTTHQVACHIVASEVTVVTNALSIMVTVMQKPDLALVVLGGMMLRPSGTTLGPTTQRELAGFVFDKAIIGVNAISVSQGLSTPNPFNAEIKQTIIKQSDEVIVVADHTKFGGASLYQVAPIDEIDKIVTDSGATPEQIEPFQEAGVEVLIAE